MKKKWNNLKLSKDLLFRKHFLKKSLQLTLLKSLIHNQNNNPINRAFATLKLNTMFKKKTKITIQQNRCLLTGKAKSTFKFSSFSRQSTKKLIDLGLLQNIKADSY